MSQLGKHPLSRVPQGWPRWALYGAAQVSMWVVYWLMRRALLGQLVPYDPREIIIYGALNSAVALPLFLLLDKMKMSGSRSAMI